MHFCHSSEIPRIRREKKKTIYHLGCWLINVDSTELNRLVTSWRKILSPNSSPLLNPPPHPNIHFFLSSSFQSLIPLSSPPPLSLILLSHCHIPQVSLSPPFRTRCSISSPFPSVTDNHYSFLWFIWYWAAFFCFFLRQSCRITNPAWLLHQPLCFTSIFNYTCLSEWLQSTDKLWHHAKRIIGWGKT